MRVVPAQDKVEVEALRLSLFLNLSQCFIKLELWLKVGVAIWEAPEPALVL